MKKCLVCEAPLRLVKFKCIEGYVCKTCYEKASLNFTQTIKTKTKDELLAIIKLPDQDSINVGFEISRKINQLLLFDDSHQKICLPNHKKYTKEVLKPEIFAFSEILSCEIIEEHTEKMDKKKKLELGVIKVQLTFETAVRDIWLIPNFINRESMPYRTMLSLADNIVNEVNRSKEVVAC